MAKEVSLLTLFQFSEKNSKVGKWKKSIVDKLFGRV